MSYGYLARGGELPKNMNDLASAVYQKILDEQNTEKTTIRDVKNALASLSDLVIENDFIFKTETPIYRLLIVNGMARRKRNDRKEFRKSFG